jgi:hypothetical protein
MQPTSTAMVESRSPVTMVDSKPGWMLASDAVLRIEFSWGGGRASSYGGLPAHEATAAEAAGILPQYRDGAPAGGNQNYIDGSVGWVDFRNMVRLHDWAFGNRQSRKAYGWQNDFGNFIVQDNPFFQ